MNDIEEIRSVESEAGVIATLIHNPDFYFYSEFLRPEYFTNAENHDMYAGILTLIEKGIRKIDAYNIIQVLEDNNCEINILSSKLTIEKLNEFIELSDAIARHTIEEYQLLVHNIIDTAFRRDTYKRLKKCESVCFDLNKKDIEQEVYKTIDDVMMRFSATEEIPQFKDVVDDYWAEIQERQASGSAGIPFKFPSLNDYAAIEKGELFIFAAEAKQGKSMMLLNCAVDLLKQDKAVLYLDSELNSRLFTARILSHLTGIEYRRIITLAYTENESKLIDSALKWIKSRKFTHIYIPTFDKQTIYTTVKKVKHTQGLDVLIVDYFKGSGEGDAFQSYQELGAFVDLVKNRICGEMKIAGIGAAQATINGKVADSAKIGRNASTIALIQDKTEEEIEADGIECGNKKLRVVLNRNGMQMTGDEYIDLAFNGNKISYEEAKKHIPETPY